MRNNEESLQPTLDYQDERASALGHSIVFMRQAYPNMSLMTYHDEAHYGDKQVQLL